MTARKVLTWPKDNEQLSHKIEVEVTAFDDILKGWAQDLLDTMKIVRAYGIAAPQIGIPIRMCVVELNKKPTIMINPVITEATGRMKYDEHCLSFPGKKVPRSKRKSFIRFKYQDVEGKEYETHANGVEAVCVQHELDHFEGILLKDIGPLQKA